MTARPIGVLDGVDFHYTGEVRRVERKGINRLLDERSIVLLSPMRRVSLAVNKCSLRALTCTVRRTTAGQRNM